MSDANAAPAAAPAAPAATPTSAQPAAPTQIHAGDNFQDFQAQVQARMQARAKAPTTNTAHARSSVSQPAAPAPQSPSTEPTPAQPPAPQADPTQTPHEQVPAEPQPGEAGEPAEPTQPQITPEDLELLAKAKAWLESDEIPDEFAQRLVALKNGDAVEYETFEEVRNGRMRQRDYTRAMQQHQREKATWEQAEGFYKKHFEAIFNDENEGAAGGDAMYEIYTRAGKRKQLLALGTRLAREEQQIIDGANGVGYAIMHRLGIKDPNDYRVQSAVKREYQRRHEELDREARNRAMEFENQRLKQTFESQQQESQDNVFFEGQRKSLEQLRPRAFAAMGLNHDDPIHRRQFNVYLDAIIRQEGLTKLTPEVVMKATRAAREEIELLRKRQSGNGHANGNGNGQQRGFQPSLGPGGGAPAGAKPQQWHADSFAEKFRLPRW